MNILMLWRKSAIRKKIHSVVGSKVAVELDDNRMPYVPIYYFTTSDLLRQLRHRKNFHQLPFEGFSKYGTNIVTEFENGAIINYVATIDEKDYEKIDLPLWDVFKRWDALLVTNSKQITESVQEENWKDDPYSKEVGTIITTK